MKNYPRLIIAGVRGGSGKTTLALGIIAALRSQKGLKVVPFKKGPDFIDAGWMSIAAKTPCYNLDPFLISKEKVLDSFISHFTGDVAIIEGNRGLYDGMDTEGSYSTAELAKLLKSPVILIVDCTKMTRTTAAVVLGCMNLDKAVSIKGVVLNQVSGSRHESVVRSSIEKYCSLPVLGAIPRLHGGEFPERHMGLTPYQEHNDTEDAISFVEDIAKKYLDLDRILDIAIEAEQLPLERQSDSKLNKGKLISLKNCRAIALSSCRTRIGVIRDAAFQFYYPENLEELQKTGAEIVEINALQDDHLPDVDALYIGGGFPETNAIRLAENVSFRNSIRNAAENGLPIYAECGGLMFLGDSIIVEDKKYPMTGVFPIVFEMKKKPQAHGYTIVEVERENPFYPVGTVLHGHEFHYSAVMDNPPSLSKERQSDRATAADVFTGETLTSRWLTKGHENVIPTKVGIQKQLKLDSRLHGNDELGVFSGENIYFAFAMKRGHGIKDRKDGICYKNVFAAYTHIHALGATDWVDGLINRAKEFKKGR